MALTIADVTTPNNAASQWTEGPFKVVLKDVTFDSSYPTGGEAVTAQQVGLNMLVFADLGVAKVSDGSTAMLAGYVANADQLGGVVFLWETAAVVDLPLDEFDNAGDASTYTVRMKFYGH